VDDGDDLDLDDDVVIDHSHIDAEDAATVVGRELARALSEMRQIEAVHLSTTWALSSDPVRRAAIAKALEWSFTLVPDALILDHLSHDPDPMIRAACARSAWARRAVTRNSGVLDRLASDPDPEVRAIAARAR
jgi:hypothetical protein